MEINNLAFFTWPVKKQYLAAHFFLSEEKPMSISEAQQAQLGALHLYVAYGHWNGHSEIPEFEKCTSFEKKKRIEEWKKLVDLSKKAAMKKFVELTNSFFPNWFSYKRLYTDFEADWKQLKPRRHHKKLLPKIETQPNNSGFTKSVSPKAMNTSLELARKKNTRPSDYVKNFQLNCLKDRCKVIPKLDANKDASDINFFLKSDKISDYYKLQEHSEKFPVISCKNKSPVLRNVIENLKFYSPKVKSGYSTVTSKLSTFRETCRVKKLGKLGPRYDFVDSVNKKDVSFIGEFYTDYQKELKLLTN